MSEKHWKTLERRVARLLHCKRTTRIGTSGPDVENALLSVEVKSRQRLPDWLTEGVAQARGYAEGAKVPLLAVGSPKDSAVYIVMHVADFRAWYIGIPEAERRRKHG